MDALLYGCIPWAPHNAHYRKLRATHHKYLLQVIGYHHVHRTYRQMSYANALKKTGSQSVEVTVHQRRLLFAGALDREGDKRPPKRLLFAGRLEGGGGPGLGQPAQHWQKSLKDDFKAFRALHGSAPTFRRTFGVDRLVWTDAARNEEGVPWYTGVLLGAEGFMASWHKSQEEASRLREVNRAAKALLVNQKTKRRNAEEEGGGRERKSIERMLVVIASEKPVHCFFCVVLLFCCLDLPPSGASLIMNGFDLTTCLELNLLCFHPVSS